MEQNKSKQKFSVSDDYFKISSECIFERIFADVFVYIFPYCLKNTCTFLYCSKYIQVVKYHY